MDYWIVKVDSVGNKKWDKDFGGVNEDLFSSLQKTSDNGCIIGGYSPSVASCDKTQSSWNNNYDFWIIKIDSLGNTQWDKTFGGLDDDRLFSVVQTFDRGFLLGGTSNSGIGGDKTQINCNFSKDYWIVKTDSSGNKLWDKDFGGLASEDIKVVSQTFDGGYILAGTSESGIGCDKTQTICGSSDYWVVKIDSVGNKSWDKNFGGISQETLQCWKIH